MRRRNRRRCASLPPFPLCYEDEDWEEGPIRVFRSDLKESFEQHCRKSGVRSAGAMGRGNAKVFASGLKKFVPDLKELRDPVPEDRQFEVSAQGDGRARSIGFPRPANLPKRHGASPGDENRLADLAVSENRRFRIIWAKIDVFEP